MDLCLVVLEDREVQPLVLDVGGFRGGSSPLGPIDLQKVILSGRANVVLLGACLVPTCSCHDDPKCPDLAPSSTTADTFPWWSHNCLSPWDTHSVLCQNHHGPCRHDSHHFASLVTTLEATFVPFSFVSSFVSFAFALALASFALAFVHGALSGGMISATTNVAATAFALLLPVVLLVNFLRVFCSIGRLFSTWFRRR